MTTLGLKVYHVKKPFTLIQALGYLKFNRAQQGKAVYYRGQAKLRNSLVSSLLRGVTTTGRAGQRVGVMNGFLDRVRNEQRALLAVPHHAQEAVLQHYGLRTRWLDVVDNVWVALWFACHSALAHGPRDEYLHFERRVPRRIPEAERYAYILLIEVSNRPMTERGLCGDASSEAIDLRIAVPSHFIRPHLQHGLVVRGLNNGETALDYMNLVAGIIRIDLEDALEWLGAGDYLSVHGLFPPPAYDFGYSEVLAGIQTGSDVLKEIHRIGA